MNEILGIFERSKDNIYNVISALQTLNNLLQAQRDNLNDILQAQIDDPNDIIQVQIDNLNDTIKTLKNLESIKKHVNGIVIEIYPEWSSNIVESPFFGPCTNSMLIAIWHNQPNIIARINANFVQTIRRMCSCSYRLFTDPLIYECIDVLYTISNAEERKTLNRFDRGQLRRFVYCLIIDSKVDEKCVFDPDHNALPDLFLNIIDAVCNPGDNRFERFISIVDDTIPKFWRYMTRGFCLLCGHEFLKIYDFIVMNIDNLRAVEWSEDKPEPKQRAIKVYDK